MHLHMIEFPACYISLPECNKNYTLQTVSSHYQTWHTPQKNCHAAKSQCRSLQFWYLIGHLGAMNLWKTTNRKKRLRSTSWLPMRTSSCSVDDTTNSDTTVHTLGLGRRTNPVHRGIIYQPQQVSRKLFHPPPMPPIKLRLIQGFSGGWFPYYHITTMLGVDQPAVWLLCPCGWYWTGWHPTGSTLLESTKTNVVSWRRFVTSL